MRKITCIVLFFFLAWGVGCVIMKKPLCNPLFAFAKQVPVSLSSLQSYPGNMVFSGSRAKRQIALTFDDGPDLLFTPQILNVLKAHHVHATFFLMAERAQKYPQIVRRIKNEGHAVGGHTYSHLNLLKAKSDRFEWEMKKSEEVLRPLLGYNPRLFRPPYGAATKQQLKWLHKHGYTVVHWDVDSLDWKQLSAKQITQNILRQAKPGSIILLHSASGKGGDLTGTVQALPGVIKALKAAHLEFVTVPEIL